MTPKEIQTLLEKLLTLPSAQWVKHLEQYPPEIKKLIEDQINALSSTTFQPTGKSADTQVFNSHIRQIVFHRERWKIQNLPEDTITQDYGFIYRGGSRKCCILIDRTSLSLIINLSLGGGSKNIKGQEQISSASLKIAQTSLLEILNQISHIPMQREVILEEFELGPITTQYKPSCSVKLENAEYQQIFLRLLEK
jgi:hypothetical protein